MHERTTCPACRRGLEPGGQFCGYCGFRLTSISEAAHRALVESIQASPAPGAFDPLPALSADVEADSEADTSADVFAETMAAGEADGAVGGRGAARVAVARALERAAGPGPGVEPARDPALDDTDPRQGPRGAAALLEPTGGPAALLEPTGGPAALEPAAALPGTNAGEEGESPDATAGGTLSYAASPGARPAPSTAGERAVNLSGRRAARFPFKVEVSYTSAHNFYTGVIENVSSGGIFVATDRLGVIGEEYEVSFTVPGIDRPCLAICQVRWIRAAATGRDAGMGLKFVRLDAATRAAVELFLNHREPILFEG